MTSYINRCAAIVSDSGEKSDEVILLDRPADGKRYVYFALDDRAELYNAINLLCSAAVIDSDERDLLRERVREVSQ